ncbi:MAG: tRNA preQ1(34) S-adenosylmethionine ribosyltransferase-isomerase QueA [Planctomycetaceae bacterium]
MSSESVSQSSAATPNVDRSFDDVALYDYELPEELIAKEPLPERDASRLLVLDRQTGAIQHCGIRELADLLKPGDCLVLNDTRVLPARLIGQRANTGGKWEGLYLGQAENGDWRLIGQTRGYLKPGERVVLIALGDDPLSARDSLRLTLIDREPDGVWRMRPEPAGDTLTLLQQFGTMPLPPYMRRKVATDSDWQRYQTTYASHPGSVAAPTAGLHLTESLLSDIAGRGIHIARVTLHVGLGTFRPISVTNLSEHAMHSEWCEIGESAVRTIQEARERGGRIVAVGTTSVRTLETAAANGPLHPWRGTTSIFIRPPYQFRVVDALLTNFHLPRSTLFVLVSAMAGLDHVQAAYAAAIRERYRFYSYGDAMLILPDS